MSKLTNVSRRDFLKLTGITSAGLVLGAVLPVANPVFAASQEDNDRLNLFVSIAKDGQVDIVCHRSEMGQGIRTGIPQVIADELEADWSKVNVIQGLADERYGSQNTDGSRSIRNLFQMLRQMGASSRTMLQQAAANQWNVDLNDTQAEQNFIINTKTGAKLSYGELAEAAAAIAPPAPESLTYKSKSEFKLIGKEVPIVDLPDIVKGSTTFGQDVQLPDMLYASIERSPVIGANVKSYNREAAEAVKGVQGVWKMPERTFPVLFNSLPGVAVVADNTWAAMQGRKQLNVQWEATANDDHDSAAYLKELEQRVTGKGRVVREQGDAYAAIAAAADTHTAAYTVPYLVHAPMEPPAATAVLTDAGCEVWACTQTPQSTQTNVAAALGIDKSKVKVNVTLLGGGFGRKSKPDYSVEAALLARAFKRPVKVVWSREDDIQQGYYHAISAQHYQAGFDAQGQVTGWIQRTAFPSISWTFTGTTDEAADGELSLGFADMPLATGALSCEVHKAPAHTRIGWVRSVSNIHHAFAIGSFVDELAVKTNTPPQAMWHNLLGPDRNVDPSKEGFKYTNYGASMEDFPIDTKRIKGVLDKVVQESGADGATAENEGWGISVHRSFITYVAVAAKVRVENGELKVLELHSAIDAGTVVNPDRVRSQQEGSMIFGLSIALLGEISFKDGKVEQSNYHNYQVARMHQSPAIKTYIIESDAGPGGVGEPGTPPVSAAIANAVYRASGMRIRDLPMSKHLRV